MSSIEALIAHPDAAWLLEERLLSLRGDSPEKMAIREALVEVCFAGGDRVTARRHLEEAHQLAIRMGDTARVRRLRETLVLHLLSIGLAEQALVHLRPALYAAVEEDDTLMVVTLGVVLSAMRLEAEDFDEAMKLGALVVSAAQRRANWPGVADGLITQATCMLTDPGQLTDAVTLLLHGGQRLNNLGAAASVNLIKARLGEVRVQVGPEVFDAALSEALARLRSESPAQ